LVLFVLAVLAICAMNASVSLVMGTSTLLLPRRLFLAYLAAPLRQSRTHSRSHLQRVFQQPDGLLIIDQIQRLKLAVQQVKDAGDLQSTAAA